MDFRKYALLSSVGRYVNHEYRREADTSRRNGNQLGAPSYDWDLSYWQATLANLHWDLAGLSRRPTAFWFPPGLNPWDSILLPTMRPAFMPLHLHCERLALIFDNVSHTLVNRFLLFPNCQTNFRGKMCVLKDPEATFSYKMCGVFYKIFKKLRQISWHVFTAI